MTNPNKPFLATPSSAGMTLISSAWVKENEGSGQRDTAIMLEEIDGDQEDLLEERSTAQPKEQEPYWHTLRFLPSWAKYSLMGIFLLTLIVLLWYTITYTFAPSNTSIRKRNVILLISDGFGPASQTMARQYIQSTQGLAPTYQLPLDTIQVGASRTRSSDSLVTDSAAGATAFSCAIKSYNGAIAVDDQKNPCATILEAVALQGYRTGLIATSRITHATPAAFASHVIDRDLENEIALQEIGQTPLKVSPDLLLGGGLRHFIPKSATGSKRTDDIDVTKLAESQGYHVIYDRSEFDALARDASSLPLLGLFAKDHMTYEIDRNPAKEPSLVEMAQKALSILTAAVNNNASTPGFFLMVEGSRIDHAGHENDPATHLQEILMYNDVIAAAKAYVDQYPDTIIISVSDHECGGLTVARQLLPNPAEYLWYPEAIAVVKNSSGVLSSAIRKFAASGMGDIPTYITRLLLRDAGITNITDTEMTQLVALATSTSSTASQDLLLYIGNMISVRAHLGWTTTGHSAVDVNLYAYGQADLIAPLRGNHDNTDIGAFLVNYYGVNLAPLTHALQPNHNTRRWMTSVAPGLVDDDVHQQHD